MVAETKLNVKIKVKKTGIDGPVAQTILIIFLLITLALSLMPIFITMIMSVKSPQDIQSNSIWSFPKSGWYFSNYSKALTVLSAPLLNTVVIDLISTVVVLFLSCYIAFLFERKNFGGKKVLFYLSSRRCSFRA